MKRIHRIRIFILLLPGCLLSPALIAQQEEVRVVKPYTPTLSGAEKIQVLPGMDEDIEYEKPTFRYSLFTKRYESEFRVEPIQAARMVKMPLRKLYKSQLNLGLGNYLTPYAELNVNQLRSRKGTFGLHLKHYSMHGKVKLDNQEKVDAGFNENLAEIYGDHFFRNAVLEYNLGSSYNSHVHYGVDPELDTALSREAAVEPYFTAAAGIGLHSMHADSFHLNYNTGLDYYFFTHRFILLVHGGTFHLELDKKFRVINLAADLGYSFYGHYPDWDTVLARHSIIQLNPRISKGNKEWMFTAGINTYSEIRDGVFTPHFYPRATFQFNIVREVIVPYFGVGGYLESNNYRKTVEENPYVVPGLSLLPTNHKLVAYAGLKGKFSDAVTWNIKGSYEIMDDAYFYVNDTSNRLMNQFRVVYDDLTLVTIHGEFTVRPGDDWKIFLKGNYYKYDMVRLEHPWHKPGYDLSVQLLYNMGDKILLDGGVYVIGSRYYETFGSAGDAGTLPLTVDANLGVEYRYSKLLSFWARFNNLAAQRYYIYNQYPSYRFRVMLGLTYAL